MHTFVLITGQLVCFCAFTTTQLTFFFLVHFISWTSAGCMSHIAWNGRDQVDCHHCIQGECETSASSGIWVIRPQPVFRNIAYVTKQGREATPERDRQAETGRGRLKEFYSLGLSKLPQILYLWQRINKPEELGPTCLWASPRGII